MSSKLLWGGLTAIVAVPPLLALVGFNAATTVFVIIGAVSMVVGAILLVLDR